MDLIRMMNMEGAVVAQSYVVMYLTYTKPECGTRPFYSLDPTQIRNYALKEQKMLSPVNIPLIGHIRHQAINSALQSW